MPASARGASTTRSGRSRFNLSILGVVPFLLFAIAFLIVPASYLVIGSLQDKTGAFTVRNYADLGGDTTREAYLASIEISAVTAVAGAMIRTMSGNWK